MACCMPSPQLRTFKRHDCCCATALRRGPITSSVSCPQQRRPITPPSTTPRLRRASLDFSAMRPEGALQTAQLAARFGGPCVPHSQTAAQHTGHPGATHFLSCGLGHQRLLHACCMHCRDCLLTACRQLRLPSTRQRQFTSAQRATLHSA